MRTLIIGGGGMAKGIAEVVPDTTVLSHEQCDVLSLSMIDDTLHEYKPDVMIVTAGVSHPGRLENCYLWGRDVCVNLIGSFNCAQAAVWNKVPTMIFIGSVAGKYGKPEHAAYSASKAGVISLVQSLGMEGYNAYAISPGRVNTPMREKDYPDDKPGTRLEPSEVGMVVRDILDGKYEKGDNIIIRRIGYETVPVQVDKGEPWREELKVGQPKTL